MPTRLIIAVAVAIALLSAISQAAPPLGSQPAMCKIYG